MYIDRIAKKNSIYPFRQTKKKQKKKDTFQKLLVVSVLCCFSLQVCSHRKVIGYGLRNRSRDSQNNNKDRRNSNCNVRWCME